MRGTLPARRPAAFGAALLAIGLVAAIAVAPLPGRAATRTDVKVFANPPSTLDPAAEGDIDTAGITAQLYEPLTAFDANLDLRPALAASWDVSADGRRVTFHLRPNARFSDGTPITAADVVGSWLRLVDPKAPSPLSALLLDVSGVADRLAGRSSDPSAVGIHAVDGAVVVTLDRPGSDLPSIVASPSFGVVPPSVWRDHQPIPATDQVVSGGYSIASGDSSGVTLMANPDYWAGPPAIQTVQVLFDIGGRSPVDAFSDGTVDSIQIAANDASWIAYDATLGPQLRTVPELSLTYLGFTTDRPPFDDIRMRRAVAWAVDWSRIVTLAAIPGERSATSMVPDGIPGRGEASWLPAYDPDQARAQLAAAGHPGGAGLGPITLAAAGAPFAEGIAADLKRELGLDIRIEDDADQSNLLATDPPAMWEQGWIADYPGANDFLGVLLASNSASNVGHWSSTSFDHAVDVALQAPGAGASDFDAALGILKSDVPVVPLAYGDAWALSRTGLLGDQQNGLGFTRFAGLAWAP
ncbi:MAG TPA: ABC transporter substrate-binding protein [Candidatus Limnocylindrales bacterium]|nr:ABC transporter substrate-binding protein [Candidatus Limnocylindrales bacterium]